MTLSYLLQRFDAIGPMGPRAVITIDQNFTGSASLTTMLRSVLGTDTISINAVTDMTSRADDHLTLVGTASLLNMTDAQVTFRARDLEGELFVTLEILAPSDWSFLDTFPSLPEHLTTKVTYAAANPGERTEEPNFLAQLSLGTSRLFFSNVAHYDETLAREMVPGLNFVGELYLMGILFGLGNLLRETDPARLAGPLVEFRAAPDPMEFLGIRLTAPLDINLSSLGPLSLQKASLFLKSGFHPDHRDYRLSATRDPGIYLLADAALGGRPLAMIGKYDFMGQAPEFSLNGRFEDFAVAGFSNLSQEVGVDGFGESMPEDFPAPEGLSLTELGVSFTLEGYTITRLMLGVGTKVNWEIIPDVMALKEVAVAFTVLNPFRTGRGIITTLSGLLVFKQFSLAAFTEFPGFRIGAGLPVGETLPLGDVIASFLPGVDMPEMTITDLFLSASPKEKALTVNAQIQDVLSIPIGATSFDVASLLLAIDYDKRAGGARGAMTAQMRIADVAVTLSGELNSGLTLSGTLQKLDFKKFWALVTNGEALPDEIPDIVFETLNVSVTPKTGAFSILGNAVIQWDYLTKDSSLSTTVQLSFSRRVMGSAGTSVSAFAASLSLQGSGPVDIAAGLTLNSFTFLFDYQTGIGWKLSGGAGVQLFDHALTLQAGYEKTQTAQKIKLLAMASPPAKLIDIAGVGSYTFTQFDMFLDRRKVGDNKARTFFDIRLASTLAIEGLFKMGGYLGVSDTAEGTSTLLFKPNADVATFNITFPAGEGVGIKAQLFEIGFVREAPAGWSFTGTTVIGVTGLGTGFADALPSKVTAKLVAGRSNTRISAVNVSDPIFIALPAINGKNLGNAVIQLTELGVAIKPELGLVLEAGVGLPAELNAYIGAQVFRVYAPGNPLTLARTRFTIAGTGIAMQFLSSPFTGANTVMIKGEAWFDVDFGKYGAISLKMPTFVYDGVTQYFEAGGACKITRPLALPMKPLKYFLMACNLQSFADMFPDKLPVTGLSLVNQNNDLKVDEFIAFVKTAGDVPQEITSALRQAGNLLNRFPDGFKQYFSIEVPEQLEFKFGFSPTGRISLGLLAPKQPIQVLFPSIVQSYVPMPGLMGLQLHKLTVGTIMSGSLFFGEVDAVIDEYDLPSLAISLMLPSDPSFPLPTSSQLQRRITLDDVFCIIPASQGLPIPIPIFYDQIGFDYMGVEGLGFGVRMGFPKPPLDGASAIAFFTTLKEFTSSDKALLDPKTPPGGLDLMMTFRDEFLQGPEYLGGQCLGTRGKNINVGTWKYVATMMNFFKTFSINDFIGAIPMEYRAGSAQHKIAFMKFDADWLLTTPHEFKSGAFSRLKLSASDVSDFIDVLPAVAMTGGQQIKSNEEGIVTFVRGQANLKFARLEAVLGLAASSTLGFNTGFKLSGGLGGGVIKAELKGAIMVNAPLATNAALPAATPAALVIAKASEGGKALTLNGTNAYIEIPASDSLMLSEYTIELWLRPSAGQNGDWINVCGIDTQSNGHQRNYYLEMHSQGAFYHHRFGDRNGGNSGAPDTPNGSVRWGQWQHITLINDGMTAKTLIDGKDVASGSVNGPLTLHKSPLLVGKMPGKNERFLKGDIAEIRVWKRARTTAEVASSMRSVLRGDEKDLVSLYRFDKDTGTKAIDVCGRNHGTITNGSFGSSELLALKGLSFNGAGEFIEIPDAPSLGIKAYTVEAWFKPRRDMREDWAGIFGKKGRNYALYIHRAGFVHHRFHTPRGTNDGAPDTASDVVLWDQWNHVAITNDGKTARTFVNGAQLAEAAVVGELFVDSGPLQIGRTADGSNGQYFMGEIAEIRLWRRARSLDEVRATMTRRLSGNEADLVSLWRLDDAKGTTLPDVRGKNTGTMADRSPANSDNLALEGLTFNGRGDYIEIPDSSSLCIRAYTLEAWFKPRLDMREDWAGVAGKKGRNYALFIHRAGFAHHRFHTPNGTNEGAPDTPSGVITWGQWNHVAITNDGTTARTFMNGVQLAEGTVPGELLVDNGPLQFGRTADGTNGQFFMGEIAEVRLWGRQRSLDEVRATMYQKLTGKEADLISLWRLGDAKGATLADVCGKNPGRIEVAALKAQGSVSEVDWSLPVAPGPSKRAAIQAQGHIHVIVAGHKALVGDLRLVNSDFWFSGDLDLFPKDWPICVVGRVEGVLCQSRFFLSGNTENSLFGFVLTKSRLYLSNDQIRLEGRWLGATTVLDVTWTNNDPVFKGSAVFFARPSIDFGTIRIAGVKVADNVRISVEIHADVAVAISKRGFSAAVTASFFINGAGFSTTFGVDVAPSEVGEIINWIRQKIIDSPGTYLAHLFADAGEWLRNIGNGSIEFAKDSGELVGAGLKAGFNVTADAVADVMQEAGYAANQVGAALSKAYNESVESVVGRLKAASYPVEAIGGYLKDTAGYTAAAASTLLRGAGYGANEVGKALSSTYETSADEAAKALRSAGYAVKEVGDTMQSTFGKTTDECKALLKSAGYVTNEVNDAYKTATSAVTSAVNTVGNTTTKTTKKVGKAFKKLF